jgi:DNA-binding response OmpR family regulator
VPYRNDATSRIRPVPPGLVLFVEDDPDLLALLTATFAEIGFTSQGARLLIEAQRLVADLRFDLIVVDMALPDGTGVDFITWLQSLGPAQGGRTPCIAITGHPSFAPTATAAGFRATLHKPLELRAVVKAAMDVLADPSPPPSVA